MTRPLWTLAEIVAATGGKLDLPHKKTGGPEGVPPAEREAGLARAVGATIAGISIDTRTLEPGDLFVPLTDARDGHEFVPQAFAKGAIAALVRQGYERTPGDGMLICVDDPLRALERIGIAARTRLCDTARVVAVTGSAGKTGTKEMLRACLKVCASSPDKVHAPEKSFNNHWGVPLTLARMPADAEYAVFEIGMNHAGEISPLTRMVRPHIAIVTNVLPVHVGNFPDGEIGVANAKAEIFEGLTAPREVPAQGTRNPPGFGTAPNGVAIILRDSPHYERLRAAALSHGAAILTFGRDQVSDAVLVGCEAHPGEGAEPISMIAAHLADTDEGFVVEYELGMPGAHIAANSLAVVLALRQLRCLKPAALRPLQGLRPASGRGARQTIGARDRAILLLDESYNANPASMAAALQNLAGVPECSRRIAILGDMLELGAEAVQYHLGLKDAAAPADLVLCCGPNMRYLSEALPADKRGAWAPTSSELIPAVLATIRPGDAVMVKGSLGSRMAPIVEAIKMHFAGG